MKQISIRTVENVHWVVVSEPKSSPPSRVSMGVTGSLAFMMSIAMKVPVSHTTHIFKIIKTEYIFNREIKGL